MFKNFFGAGSVCYLRHISFDTVWMICCRQTEGRFKRHAKSFFIWRGVWSTRQQRRSFLFSEQAISLPRKRVAGRLSAAGGCKSERCLAAEGAFVKASAFYSPLFGSASTRLGFCPLLCAAKALKIGLTVLRGRIILPNLILGQAETNIRSERWTRAKLLLKV